MKNVVTLLAVVGTCAPLALAVPRESYSFAGPYSVLGRPLTPPNTDPFVSADFTGSSNVAPLAQPYTAARLKITGTIDTAAQTNANPASQCRIDVFPPTGLPFTVTPTTNADADAAPATVSFTVNVPIPADVTSTVGSWGIQFYDITNSGVGADASFSNVVVSIDDGTIGADVDLGTIADGTTNAAGINVDATTVKWVKFVTTADITVDNNRYLDISTTAGGDTEIGLYRNDGSFVASDDDSAGNALSILSFGSGELGPDSNSVRDGYNGPLTAGTYWLAVGTYNVAFGTTDYQVTSTGPGGSIDIEMKKGDFVPPPPPPPPSDAIDVGAIGTATPGTEGLVTRTLSVTDGNILQWYKFTTAADATASNGFYVDIDTEGTGVDIAVTTGNICDTEIGVYNGTTGRLLAADDDSGSGQRSLLTFGDTASARAPISTSPDAPDGLRDGNDGTMVAGVYYVSLSTYNTAFATGYAATPPTDRSGTVGDRIINWRSNLPASTCTCCNLSNVAGANQSTTPDDALTADDIIVFLGWFFANDARANVAGANQSTIPDNVLTADDIIVFLGRYFAGC